MGGHPSSLSALLKVSGADLPSDLWDQAAALDGDAQKSAESPETHKDNSDIHMNDADHLVYITAALSLQRADSQCALTGRILP